LLTGSIEPSELREYINGPPLEIEVHDRDRIVEKRKLQPTLFGDDLEDEKISNVGTIASEYYSQYYSEYYGEYYIEYKLLLI